MKELPIPKLDSKSLASWIIYVLAAVVIFLFGIYSKAQDDLLTYRKYELEAKQRELEEYKNQIMILNLKLEKCKDDKAALLDQFYVKPGIKTLTITPSTTDEKKS